MSFGLRQSSILRFLGALTLLSLWTVALVACTQPDDKKNPPDKRETPKTARLQQGAFSVFVEPDPWELQVKRGTTTLVTLKAEQLQLGFVGEYSDKYNYDPYWFAGEIKKPSPPIGLKWVAPSSIVWKKSDEKSAEYEATYKYGSKTIKAVLTLSLVRSGTWRVLLKPENQPQTQIYTRLDFVVGDKENYYGLGEYFDQVAHLGRSRAMQFEADFRLESTHNEAHFPIPFFTSTRGWGVFVKSYRPGVFDMGHHEKGRLRVIYEQKQLEFYLFAADHPLKVPGLYTQVTGAPAVPAQWAFGTMLWRDEHKDQAQVLEDAANIRKHDLAISVMWIDRPYDTAVNDFGFDPKRYPDAKKMVQTLNAQGFRLGLWHTPYLEPKSKNHKRFKENGWFVGMGFQGLNPWSDPIDLTNPKAFSAWQELLKNYRKLGIEGFKLDYGQDIQVGVSKIRPKYTFHNGEDNLTMHHKYALYYHRAYFELLGKDGGFLINRGGVWGDQIYTSIVWPGDLDANFAKHYDKIPGKDKHYVGGLIASIIGGLTLSQSGYPFYGSDTGGYRGSRPTKEVMMRWGQQTAFSTVMQIGGQDPNVNPWDFKKYKDSQFDQELLDMYRVYIRIHTRLFPYIYTYAQLAKQHKPGPTRPYGIAFPDENYHPNDQYMLGEYILVAPITQAVRKRDVQFPKGHDWMHWWTGKIYKGGTKASVDAPLNQLPVFLKVGTLLPMLRPDIDTLSPTTDKTLVSFANDVGLLYVKVVPGEDATFTLYDKTRVSMTGVQPTQLASWSGDVFNKGVVFEVLRVKQIKKLEINGKTVSSEASEKDWKTCKAPCWWWEQGKNTLLVKVGSGEQNVMLDAEWN